MYEGDKVQQKAQKSSKKIQIWADEKILKLVENCWY